MAQDFAKQRTPTGVRRKPTGRAATRTLPAAQSSHWSWYFSGLMSGVIVAIVAWLGVVKLDADATESAQVAQASDKPVEEPTFNFGFYTDLANAEVDVTPPPTAESAAAGATTASSAAAASTANTSPISADTNTELPDAKPAATGAVAAAADQPRYLLQVGSFQNRKDAETHRARLLLLNMDANIVAGVAYGREVHRVQVSPFASRASAEETRELLSSNGIDSIVLLMR